VTRQVIVDSCVGAKWVIRQENSEEAIDLLAADVEIVAPDMILVEVANVLWKTVKRGLLSAKQAEARLAGLPGFFNRLLPTFDLVPEALELGLTADVPVYDCVYAVASRRTGASLVTADKNLVARLAGRSDTGNIIHIADWK
jgi:predicted nucleic acid-binding protein